MKAGLVLRIVKLFARLVEDNEVRHTCQPDRPGGDCLRCDVVGVWREVEKEEGL